MQWIEILGLVLGSSVISSMLTLVANRNKRAAETDGTVSEHYDTYADRLERRQALLETRVALLENRDSIFDRAVSTAYRCPYAANCPTLDFLKRNPVPPKVEGNGNENKDNGER